MADNRDDLIEAVRRGRRSPEDAEAEAERLGLGPLSFKPPISDCDPMCAPYWTPIMVVAWIVWRTPEAVREAWSEYVGRCWMWRYRKWHSIKDETIYEGYFLERPEPPSLLTLLRVDAYPHPCDREPRAKHVDLTGGRDEVLNAFRTGRIQATGVSLAGGGPRREILPFEWIDLIFDSDADDDRFTHKRGLQQHGYQHVLVPRDQALRLWKPVPRPTPTPVPAELPAVVRPDGAGFMTVFHALLWIATSGGAERFSPDDGDRWQRAFDMLLPELASGDVALSGEGLSERAVIPPYLLAACRFDPPFGGTPADLLHGTDLYLRSYPYIDEEHWRGGFDDALVVGVQERWTRLMVPKDAILKAWPFGSNTPTATGAPGRPTSMHLVRGEFNRRRDAALLEKTLAQEAAALHEWFQKTHPAAPPPSSKTICNNIRSEFRAAKKA